MINLVTYITELSFWHRTISRLFYDDLQHFTFSVANYSRLPDP